MQRQPKRVIAVSVSVVGRTVCADGRTLARSRHRGRRPLRCQSMTERALPFDPDAMRVTLQASGQPWSHAAARAEVDSTQTWLRQWLADDPPRDFGWRLALARHQTAGRGRNGAPWWAAPGTALLMSMGGPVSMAPERWAHLSLVAGLAVRDTLQRRTDTPIWLKWPNDLVTLDAGRPRKLAGLLGERVGGPCADPLWLCGIGVNVTSAPPPQGLAMPATSLAELGAQELDIAHLAVDCAIAVRAEVDAFVRRGGTLDVVRLERHLAFVGRAVSVDLGAREGQRWLRLDGLDPSGELRGRWLAADGTALDFASVSPLCIAAVAPEAVPLAPEESHG